MVLVAGLTVAARTWPWRCGPEDQVRLSAPGNTIVSSVDLTAEVRCAAAGDAFDVVIAEPRGIDVDSTNPHPEYYATWPLDQATKGSYGRTVAFPAPPGSVVTYYVVRLTGAARAVIVGRENNNMVLRLPAGIAYVSAKVTVTRYL